MSSLTVVEPVDQTSPSDAGHTTSEYFFTKIVVICGLVISVGGFVGEIISAVSGILPGGSTTFRVVGIVGSVVAVASKIAYEVSRTLIKMKLTDAEIAASKTVMSNGDAAATVLGDDAPRG